MGKRVVIALGGNALGNNLPEQMIAVTNNANVRAAVSMLGGSDTSATDIWWAKKN